MSELSTQDLNYQIKTSIYKFQWDKCTSNLYTQHADTMVWGDTKILKWRTLPNNVIRLTQTNMWQTNERYLYNVHQSDVSTFIR